MTGAVNTSPCSETSERQRKGRTLYLVELLPDVVVRVNTKANGLPKPRHDAAHDRRQALSSGHGVEQRAPEQEQVAAQHEGHDDQSCDGVNHSKRREA
jgi:hypothetical protein